MPSSACQTSALRSEEHTSELQSHDNLVCRLLLEKKHPTGIGRGPPPPSTSPPASYRLPQPAPDCGVALPAGVRAAFPLGGARLGAFVFFKDGPPPNFPLFPHPPPLPT